MTVPLETIAYRRLFDQLIYLFHLPGSRSIVVAVSLVEWAITWMEHTDDRGDNRFLDN